MAHLDFFGLENFRVFKERTDFSLKPISVLIGANSSGKSSFSKGLILFKDILEEGGLDFKGNENRTQLGGFENAITRGADKEEISFFYKLPIKNFPFIGGESDIYMQLEFGIEGLESRKFLYEGEVLIEFRKSKLYFNLEYFFNSLYFPDNYIVKELEEPLFPSPLNRQFQGKGKYGIIDPTIESEAFSSESDALTDVLSVFDKKRKYRLKNLSYKPIYLSEVKEDINDIEKFYNTKFSNVGFVEQDLFDEILQSYDEVEGAVYFPEPTQNPLEVLLKNTGLGERIARFIDIEIFGGLFRTEDTKKKELFSKSRLDQALEDWKNLKNKIVHHESKVERTKRVYLLGDSTLILHGAEKIEKGQSYKFIKKWCSEEGFDLEGDLKLEYNPELAFWTIKVGEFHLSDQGQGISQIITLLVNICSQTKKIFLVEEPETSLHPSYQSKLADFFIDAQKTFGHQFIIETHSEYLIRKLQYSIAKKDYKAEDVVIHNFRKVTKENEEVVKQININKDGSLSSDFYPGFFDEAISLELELLKLKRSQLN